MRARLQRRHVARSAALHAPEVRIQALRPLDECIVGTGFDDPALVHDDDAVRMPHGREPVGDDDHRAALADVRHVALHDGLAFIVQRARGLVEDEDARVGEERAGDRDALALAARQARTLLADDGVVALRQLADEVVRPRQARRVHHGLDGRGRVRDGDVLAHAAVEQQVLLQYHADLPSQLRRIDQADVDTVHEDAALLGYVQALHELGERALAGARAPHDADHLAGADVQAHAMQHGGRFRAVAEVHAVQRDPALDGRQLRRAARGHFRARVEDVPQAGHGDAGLLEVRPQLGHAHDGLRHPLGEHVECHELPHGQPAVHHEVGAVPERGGVDELADQADTLVGPGSQVLRLEARADVSRQLVVPATREGGFQRARLHGLDARHGLHQHGLVLRAARELVVEPPAQHGHHGQAQAHVERQADQHDERQRHAVHEHHADEEDGEQHVEHHGERIAREEAADVLQLAHPRHRVPHPPGLEVGQGQLDQVPEEARAQFHVDAARRVAEDVAAQSVEQALEDHHHDQPRDQHVQRGEAPVHQHLVHHDLEEERAHQREQLQHQRDEQHLAQQLAVLDQAGDEPGEIELGEFTRQAGTAGDQDELPRPAPGEILHGFDGRAALLASAGRVLQQHPLAVALRHHDGLDRSGLPCRRRIIGHERHGGQRAERQPCGAGAHLPGLQAYEPGGLQQFLRADAVVGRQPQPVGQRRRIAGNVVQPGDQAQGMQWAVGHPLSRILLFFQIERPRRQRARFRLRSAAISVHSTPTPNYFQIPYNGTMLWENSLFQLSERSPSNVFFCKKLNSAPIKG